jgi:hypothetical protein
MLRELQGRPPMADGKASAVKRPILAFHKPVFQRTLIHAFDKVERTGTQLQLMPLNFTGILPLGVAGILSLVVTSREYQACHS